MGNIHHSKHLVPGCSYACIGDSPGCPKAATADQHEERWWTALSLEAIGCPGSLDTSGTDELTFFLTLEVTT